MAWTYEKLWIMLLKRKMKRIQLKALAGISSSALAHMGKDEPVTMDVLGKICQALNCRIEDIVEYIPEYDYAAEFDNIVTDYQTDVVEL